MILLLASLILLIIVYPLFQEKQLLNSLLSAFFVSLVPLAGIYATARKRKPLKWLLVLAVPLLILVWLNAGVHSEVLIKINSLLVAFYYGYITFIVIRFILNSKQVTANVMLGVVSVYLLLAIMWSIFYAFLNVFLPGAFFNADSWPDFIYFSFITLTTLGYGDIAPVAGPARSLAILEVLTGVVFTTIILAHLLSAYGAEREKMRKLKK